MEWIGWLAAGVLLFTVGSQVVSQLRSRSTRGVSIWLYIGQVVASTLFTIHAINTEAWVFAVVNPITGLAGLVGLYGYWRFDDSDDSEDDQKAFVEAPERAY